MFKSKNFCHIASNNRNQVKVGVFVYRTTDDLATVSTSGYFNERIIDINLHDFIIHEKVDNTDATKVERNLLAVSQRTLDNVATVVVKSKWEVDTETAIANLQTYVDTHFVKLDGTSIMTGPLLMRATADFKCAIAPYWDGVGFFKLNDNNSVTLMASLEYQDSFTPAENNTYNIGTTSKKWKNLYLSGKLVVATINNGYDIAVPVTNSADTLALKSQVDDAANSGEQLYTTGVWYAKMYAATVVPTGAEYDGRNYADFSQVDSDNNPIIVIYEGQSGAWVQIATITPPANHNGYMTITSKIWDIVEQSGQQGGFVLWAHNTHAFTPYPRIVSFENAALTGISTAPTPTSSSPSNQIANKDYVDTAIANGGSGRNVGDMFFTSRKDSELNGAVECNGATYQTTDFTGAQSIGALLEAGKIPYVSLAQYIALSSNNGSIGVFGWDGAGTTTFRVPTLSNIFVEADVGTSHIGDYIPAGAPNIVGQIDLNCQDGYQAAVQNASGALQPIGNTSNIARVASSGRATYDYGIKIDASLSNSVYGNSNTVQPRAVIYRPMVQLAISATDEAVETCTSVLSQVGDLNTHKVIAFQIPTAQNNYTWYRKYADGWVEQGGIYRFEQANVMGCTIPLPVTMADAMYQNMVTTIAGPTTKLITASFSTSQNFPSTTTEAGFLVVDDGGSIQVGHAFWWEVKGIAA